ncbi:MAG TPA: FtsX-like permease family protein, partial [Bacteroidales bacterium]|nr:FtsX-like permease family protein [Bacteroidales bacterium]
ATGVTLTVFLHAYLTGFMGDSIEMNARFSLGHVKVMTEAYSKNMQQLPNDLAIINAGELISKLSREFPEAVWLPRIQFGGLIDVPDEKGETRAQGPVMGLSIDMLSGASDEAERLRLQKSIVRGGLPRKHAEMLISETLSRNLRINPGDRITLISSGMNGEMSFTNFIIAGTISLGQEALDRGMVIADIEDIRAALDMEDATGEIVGFLKTGFYDDAVASDLAEKFNALQKDDKDEYRPVMKTLSSQGSMATYVKMAGSWAAYISAVFILAMSLVLWNAGLLGGLRRYGEVGIRLAMGEEKGHIYRSMIIESVMIGIIGSVTGTALGLFCSWLMQKYGLDISGAMKGSSLLMPDRIRARITPADYYLGFIPGLISTVIGTMLSGIGIYKRQTSRLFKELEAQ